MKISFAGQTFQLLPDRAALWLERSVLLVSDLHLGKDLIFQSRGFSLSCEVEMHDVRRLASLLDTHSVRELWILGDFAHGRLSEESQSLISFLDMVRTRKLPWRIVAGNHDRHLASCSTLAEHVITGFVSAGIHFVHAPNSKTVPAICGHLHPVFQRRSRTLNFRTPCFYVTAESLILPSFGSHTGGFAISPRPGEQVYLVTENQVMSLPERPLNSSQC